MTPLPKSIKIYLVGGAVRDRLLGQKAYDKDYVVVGATIDAMLTAGFKQVGAEFPVFLHPETHDEYALARIETKSGEGYKGFSFDFNPNITLEQDLLRRDLSINAIAEDEQGHIIDPYNGVKDLKNKVIRHVSHHFAEDPLRVLRLARFVAKLRPLDFTVAPDTQKYLQSMVASGELNALTPERVWEETVKALKTQHPATYFLTLKHCGALKVLFPELEALFGLGQPRQWHPEIDVGVHVMQVLQSACSLSEDVVVRFAALGHDFGKGNTVPEILPSHHGHEKRSVDLLKGFYQRYPVPNKFKTIANRVAEFHGHVHRVEEMQAKSIIKLLNNIKAWQQPETLQQFLLACKADSRGRTGFEQAEFPQAVVLTEIYNAAKSISLTLEERGNLQGKHIGDALNFKRSKVVEPIREKYATQLAMAK